MKILHQIAVLLLFALFFASNGNAQNPITTTSNQKKGIYVIFDASGSMWGKLEDQSYKIQVAKQVLQDFVQTDLGDVELAFRAYGHNRKGDCRDSELLVPFGKPSQVIASLQNKIKGINPIGKTPITYSFKEALKDFGDRSGDIILISDGIETCDEDPCELVKLWRKTNVNIKVHVVGLGLDKVSKSAMECIAEASGTDFQDASNASDLAKGLKKIKEETSRPTLWIEGFDANNKTIAIEGFLSQNGQKLHEINSNNRNNVPAGSYLMTVGVRTQNGTLYRPVRQKVQVLEGEDTRIKVQVVRPPSVKAQFVESGEKTKGTLIYAFQNNQEVFRFRWFDEVFVEEGTYEFHSQPNGDNRLKLSETFSAGDHKELLFQMVETVHVYFKTVASQTGETLRSNYHLLQHGEVKYKIHQSNGGKVLSGTYDVQSLHKTQPYLQRNIAITSADKQKTFTFEIPVGHITFRYQNADGSPANDKRCFVRIGGRRHYHESGKNYPFKTGTYVVEGWKGDYAPITFEVKVGEQKEVVLRAR